MADFINTVDVIGDDALTDSIIERSITEYNDNAIKTIGYSAFNDCKELVSVNFPAVTSIGYKAFRNCKKITTVKFPAVSTVYGEAFTVCSELAFADFPSVTSIMDGVFSYCRKLTAIILRNTEKVSELSATSSFSNTPIASGTGYIYVPAALVDSYKAATNWSTYAAQFRALEDYTVDGTITGELDPNKI